MSRESRTGGGCVLVVDDDAAIRALLELVLTAEGCNVVTAANGAEALALAAEVHPDIVLLDLVMPVMDGRTCYRRLRSNGLEAIPVVVTSASAAHSAQRELGAEGAIQKPFDIDDVVAEVRRLVPS